MSRKILIVDDQKINRMLTAKVLRDHAYELFEAENGKVALEMVEQQPFDLIILDIMMPVMDGVEACKRLKQRKEFIPVIVSTSLDNQRNDEIIAAGADDILHKPIPDAVLRMRIASYLRMKEYYDKLVGEERKLSALAMAVTANHEINQPLMILAGNMEMMEMQLADECKSEAMQRYMGKMHAAVQRIRYILDRFKRSTSVDISQYSQGTPMAQLGDDNPTDEPKDDFDDE